MKQHLFAAITELNGECEYTTSILVCCDKDADLNEWPTPSPATGAVKPSSASRKGLHGR